MNDLAITERSRGNHDDALRWAREAVAGLTATLGPEHPYTLSARMNLAICITDTGDVAEAREVLRLRSSRILRVFGPEHPNAMRCEANVALMDRELGDKTADVRLATLRERLIERTNERHPVVSALQRRRYLYRIIDPHQF